MIAETVNPRSRPYQPFGGAERLFYCKDAEVLLDGPAGTGKSRALLEKAHLCLLKYPNTRALAVRKTRASMTDSVLVTFEDKVLPAGSPICEGASRRMRQSYTYPNGSELVIGGMDNASKVMSTEYDLVLVFEATELSEDDFEKLSTRLRNGAMPYQQILADCNPAGPQHWLNQRCLAGRTTCIPSRHEDNPTITEDYLETLRRLTGVRRLRLYEGKWAAQEGLVYDEFGDAHRIDRMPDGWEAWRKIRSIDFGYTNPFVCLWFAIDPDGRLYLYREIYRTKTLVEDHARRIVELSGKERFEATVADHDAEDRATLERYGVKTVPAKKSITPGIQAVQARLRDAGDGRPRLFILRDCLVGADEDLIAAKKPYCTEQEFGEYVWPKGSDGKALKEVPVDDNNHGCLVAGTVIHTRGGGVPIERMLPGDSVLTRTGYRPVVAAGLTRPAAAVFEVRLSNGGRLIGTGNHPVYVEGRGYVALRALGYGDKLREAEYLPNESQTCRANQKLSSIGASSSAATPMPRTGRTVSTSCPALIIGRLASADSIKKSGSTSADRSQRGLRFTTKMVTLSITIQAIWSACLAPRTQPTMRRSGTLRQRWSVAVSSWTKSGPLRASGTGRMQAANGTANSGSGPGWDAPPKPFSVSSAEQSISRARSTSVTAFAQADAGRLTAVQAGWTIFSGSALGAAQPSPPTATASRSIAAVYVVSVAARERREPVYNLTVHNPDGEGEYFANGVLVHNCDATRYAAAYLDLGGSDYSGLTTLGFDAHIQTPAWRIS